MESLRGYDAWKTRAPEDDSEDLSGTVTITIERGGEWFEVTAEINSGEVSAAWERGQKGKVAVEQIELSEEEKERAVETFERGDGEALYYEQEREECE